MQAATAQDMTTQRHSSQRTCVVCRATKDAGELLRLGLVQGHVVFEKPGSGRGAYVCAASACLGELEGRHLARAFKQGAQLPPREEWSTTLGILAQRRVLECVGLARRQGALVVGVDAVGERYEAGGCGPCSCLLGATDLSTRGARALPQGTVVFAPGGVLGHAAGLEWVGLVCIDHEQLASRTKYWLRVWRAVSPAAAETLGTQEVAS